MNFAIRPKITLNDYLDKARERESARLLLFAAYVARAPPFDPNYPTETKSHRTKQGLMTKLVAGNQCL